jgi:hypothetical protein
VTNQKERWPSNTESNSGAGADRDHDYDHSLNYRNNRTDLVKVPRRPAVIRQLNS